VVSILTQTIHGNASFQEEKLEEMDRELQRLKSDPNDLILQLAALQIADRQNMDYFG
jgi:hypothetical protein